jgi:simple sugar transport system permease protein
MAVNVVNIKSLQFLPSEVFSMMPFLITLITLVLFSGKETAPKALGQKDF